MITLITGAPGAGKTAALVDLLSGIKDRQLHVCGIPDLQIPHVSLEDPTKWPDEVPDSAVVVIDEVQNYWRPTGPGQRPGLDITSLETHRHRGLDFYIITQSPRLVHTNVRALVGRHVHLRDIGFLGRWWYEWPECAESCSASWKNAPIKKKYKLPKRIFGQYKSASEHIKPVRSFPAMLFIAIFALVATAALSFFAYKSIFKKPEPILAPVVEPSPGGVMQAAYTQPTKDPYDPEAWLPRVAHKPESAPAYDEVRQIREMPIVTGGICTASGCDCYTQQGTNAGLTDEACRAWIRSPPFNPYRVPAVERSRLAAREDSPAT